MCEDGKNRGVKCACVGDLYLYEHQIKKVNGKNFEGGNLEKRKKKEKGATAT